MKSGHELVALLRTRIGQEYVFGARARYGDAAYAGPWDCAEFVTWGAYQLTGKLYGCVGGDTVETADAYSGAWAAEARRGPLVGLPVEEAIGVAGAVLIRRPAAGVIGHVAVSTGDGGTVEAHSRRLGVTTARVAGRRWDAAALIPGVEYRAAIASPVPAYEPPAVILRLTRPMQRGALVQRVQIALLKAGHHPGVPDGIYGPRTQAAVIAYQQQEGLLVDGEVGPQTFRDLGVAA